MEDLNDPKLQERVTTDLRQIVREHRSLGEIERLLPEPINTIVNEHFAEGGLGYTDQKSIFNLVKMGSTKRTVDQADIIIRYLKRISKLLKQMDYTLVKQLIEKFHAQSFK